MKQITVATVVLVFLFGCSSTKTTVDNSTVHINLDTISIVPQPDYEKYRAAEEKKVDLIHTKLNVQFDWKQQHLLGQATLTLRPHFYSVNNVEIDAKGFEIIMLALKEGEEFKELDFSYDNKKLKIELNRPYTRIDTFDLYFDYIAKPNDLKQTGSAAITQDKGLYFINPLNEVENKPQQIWTQGETEASSCWFPTIDKPNQKMSQEISITVEDKFKTLSNGELVFQTENGNGTRTDYWKQQKPHAPYLAMMAIGEFAVVEDTWRDSIEVNYLVEKEYEPYAMEIFGTTPEMMECFSKRLDYDYPWNKYHQVVVRDYVSGAMENTSAVIHGEFLHQTSREMIDNNNEDIIAHELFHHWFGDLVTCESWSNLPLNESFATYGEYLWREWKYGREDADRHLQQMLDRYISESRYKKENMIRFSYRHRDDMFDSHSYAKGGRILHMLRKEVGDDAFFSSLTHYLKENSFKSAEIHHLRLAFEEVTGKDLNYFFNQWFLESGHPELTISYSYGDSIKRQKVIIQQTQKNKGLIYELPMEIDFYFENKVERRKVVINKEYEEFDFEFDERPILVNVDAEKSLLGEKQDQKTTLEWIYQYNKAPLYMDRYEALEALIKDQDNSEERIPVLLNAMKDKNWNLRKYVIENVDQFIDESKSEIKNALLQRINYDGKSLVRAAAINALSTNYKDTTLLTVYEKSLKDQSFVVISEALTALGRIRKEQSILYCKPFESIKSKAIQASITSIYGSYGRNNEHDFFMKRATEISGYGRITFIHEYESFLLNEKSNNVLNKGVQTLAEIAFASEDQYVNTYVQRVMENIKEQVLLSIQEVENNISKNIKEPNQKLYVEKEELMGISTAIVETLKQLQEPKN